MAMQGCFVKAETNPDPDNQAMRVPGFAEASPDNGVII
jgi:hypothetical protein